LPGFEPIYLDALVPSIAALICQFTSITHTHIGQ